MCAHRVGHRPGSAAAEAALPLCPDDAALAGAEAVSPAGSNPRREAPSATQAGQHCMRGGSIVIAHWNRSQRVADLGGAEQFLRRAAP